MMPRTDRAASIQRQYEVYGMPCCVGADSPRLLDAWESFFGAARVDRGTEDVSRFSLVVHLSAGGKTAWPWWEQRLAGVEPTQPADGLLHLRGEHHQLTLLDEAGTYVGHSVPERWVEAWMPADTGSVASVEAVAFWAMRHCCDLIRACLTDSHRSLHASAVGRDGYGVLIAGSPDSGKTTLALALAERGWDLLSEDLTVVRFDTHLPTVLPLVLCIRADWTTLEMLPRLRALTGKETRDHHVVLPGRRLQRVYRTPTGSAWRAKAVLLPTVVRSAPTRVTRLDPKEALLRLLNLWSPYDRTEDRLKLEHQYRIASSVPVFSVASGVHAGAIVEKELSHALT